MKRLSFLLAATLLGGCQTQKAEKLTPQDKTNQADMLRGATGAFPAHFSVDQVLTLVQAGRLDEACKYVNLALQMSPRSPGLHLMNGYVYEEMARRGDDSRKDLIAIAYRSACEQDPSNWLCMYMRGASELRERQFIEAQKHLATAATLNRHRPEIWHDLACASYYVGDIPVAYHAISQAQKLDPKNPQVIRAGAILAAASRQFDQAKRNLAQYRAMVAAGEQDVQVVSRRIDDWQAFYDRAKLVRVRGGDEGFGDLQEGSSSGGAGKEQDVGGIVFNCYILRTSERYGTTKGNNIFDALSVTFGQGSVNYNRDMGRNTETGRPSRPITGSWSQAFKYGVTMPAIQYALNIANASTTQLEIMARPMLSTMVGKVAKFIDGDQVTGSSTGGFTGSTVTSVEAGTTVEILPLEVVADGTLIFKVQLQGSLFTSPPDATRGVSGQIFTVNQSKVSTTVKAKFGETVVVSGIYQRTNSFSKSGFPVLQDIPFLQYFFASSQTSSDNRCAICLITPQRSGSATDLPKQKCTQKIAQKLQHKGLMSIGEYSSLYYILKGMDNAQLFPNFRSGDLPGPYWGVTSISFAKKISQLKSFLWF